MAEGTKRSDPASSSTEGGQAETKPSLGDKKTFLEQLKAEWDAARSPFVGLGALNPFILSDSLRSNALENWKSFEPTKAPATAAAVAANASTTANKSNSNRAQKLRETQAEKVEEFWHSFLQTWVDAVEPFEEHLPLIQGVSKIYLAMLWSQWLIGSEFDSWFRWLVFLWIMYEVYLHFFDENVVRQRKFDRMMKSLEDLSNTLNAIVKGMDVAKERAAAEKVPEARVGKVESEGWLTSWFLPLWLVLLLIMAVVVMLFF